MIIVDIDEMTYAYSGYKEQDKCFYWMQRIGKMLIVDIEDRIDAYCG